MTTDDLRDGFSDNFDFLDEEDEIEGEAQASSKLFLGMTSVQRFVLVIMLFMMVCIISSFCLLVTNKISLPFF
ncbi:MAG: hypothetical protein MAG431_01401 [Chloroflexi bacterium]|nr:hypothetical protein [Chloroflexota bacterium]